MISAHLRVHYQISFQETFNAKEGMITNTTDIKCSTRIITAVYRSVYDGSQTIAKQKVMA